MKVNPVSVEQIKNIAHQLAISTMSWDEPIPQFESRFPNVLESCVAQPFQKFSKKHLYKGLVGKGAMLFYLLIKNHPFQNGNKRIAVTTLLIFLYLNRKWVKTDTTDLYNFAIWVARSPAELKNEVVKAVEKYINGNLIDL